MDEIDAAHCGPSAIEALLSRRSINILLDPAPVGECREKIFASALTAPDHARLRPVRFLVVEGESRTTLGKLMLASALQENPEIITARQQKLLQAPLRAPMVVICIARINEHEVVPDWEQLLSAGASVTHMLVAIHAMGFGGIWRTGEIANNRLLMRRLGLVENERIIGFLYVGTPPSAALPRVPQPLEEYFEIWNPGLHNT